MSDDDPIRKYLAAGAVIGGVARSRAEELARELIEASNGPRDEVEARLEELVERGRQASELLMDTVRTEITNQLGARGIETVDDLLRSFTSAVKRSATSGREATGSAVDLAKQAMQWSGFPTGGHDGTDAAGSADGPDGEHGAAEGPDEGTDRTDDPDGRP